MNALLLLDDGWRAERVAEVLFIDAETVREHHRLYQSFGVAGIERLKYQGAEPTLSAEQLQALGAELDARLYIHDGESRVRIRGADLRCGLHAACHGQAAESAGLCLQNAKERPGESERGRAAEVRGRNPRTVDESWMAGHDGG